MVVLILTLSKTDGFGCSYDLYARQNYTNLCSVPKKDKVWFDKLLSFFKKMQPTLPIENRKLSTLARLVKFFPFKRQRFFYKSNYTVTFYKKGVWTRYLDCKSYLIGGKSVIRQVNSLSRISNSRLFSHEWTFFVAKTSHYAMISITQQKSWRKKKLEHFLLFRSEKTR